MNGHFKIFMCIETNHCTKVFNVSIPHAKVMWTCVSWNVMSSCLVGTRS